MIDIHNAARRMEAPPFDVEAMLGKEFGDRADWKDVLREADQLARELDDKSVLVRTPFHRYAVSS